MARVLDKYVKLARGAASRSMLLTPLATVLGVGAFAAIAMEGGNLTITMPNGPNGLLWPLFLLSIPMIACYTVYVAVVTSKGERIEEPVKPGPSAEDTLQPAILTRTTEETTRRVETLAERGEQKPTDLSKRREGDPDPTRVVDAGRSKAQETSRDERSQQRGEERRNVSPPPPPPPAPAPAQPAALTVTATATTAADGVGAKKEPEKVT